MNEEIESQQMDSEEPIFQILKVHTKNMAFDTPNELQITQSDETPKLDININVSSNYLKKDIHEVILNVTVTNKIEETILFLIEINQAGIFLIKNYPETEIQKTLNTLCPSLLFPDVREIISNIMLRGGFQPFYLKPINFDEIYRQQSKK